MFRIESWQEHKDGLHINGREEEKQSYNRFYGYSGSELPELYFPSVLYVGGQFKGCVVLCSSLCCRQKCHTLELC